MPAAAELLRIFGVHFRAENVRRLADADDIADIRPHSGVQPGEERRAERRCLYHNGPVDGTAEDVRLKLHEKAVDGSAAVHAQDLHGRAGVLFHRVDEIAHLIGDAFKSRADNVRARRPTGDADERAASTAHLDR